MSLPSRWSKTNNAKWIKAIRVGAEGTVKQHLSRELGGKRVRYVGTLKHWAYVKLLESAEGYDVGATFAYALAWVEWDS